MALSASVLSAAIKANLLGNANTNAVDGAPLQALCDEIADAVVSHVQTAGTVPAGIPVSTTGSAAAQTGTTTAAGTIL